MKVAVTVLAFPLTLAACVSSSNYCPSGFEYVSSLYDYCAAVDAGSAAPPASDAASPSPADARAPLGEAGAEAGRRRRGRREHRPRRHVQRRLGLHVFGQLLPEVAHSADLARLLHVYSLHGRRVHERLLVLRLHRRLARALAGVSAGHLRAERRRGAAHRLRLHMSVTHYAAGEPTMNATCPATSPSPRRLSGLAALVLRAPARRPPRRVGPADAAPAAAAPADPPRRGPTRHGAAARDGAGAGAPPLPAPRCRSTRSSRSSRRKSTPSR